MRIGPMVFFSTNKPKSSKPPVSQDNQAPGKDVVSINTLPGLFKGENLKFKLNNYTEWSGAPGQFSAFLVFEDGIHMQISAYLVPHVVAGKMPKPGTHLTYSVMAMDTKQPPLNQSLYDLYVDNGQEATLRIPNHNPDEPWSKKTVTEPEKLLNIHQGLERIYQEIKRVHQESIKANN